MCLHNPVLETWSRVAVVWQSSFSLFGTGVRIFCIIPSDQGKRPATRGAHHSARGGGENRPRARVGGGGFGPATGGARPRDSRFCGSSFLVPFATASATDKYVWGRMYLLYAKCEQSLPGIPSYTESVLERESGSGSIRFSAYIYIDPTLACLLYTCSKRDMPLAHLSQRREKGLIKTAA